MAMLIPRVFIDKTVHENQLKKTEDHWMIF